MYLLDTDHISLLDRSEGHTLRARLVALATDEAVSCIVSYDEQMRGWMAYLNTLRGADRQVEGYERLERMLDFYCRTPLLHFDQKALNEFQRLWMARIRIGTMDLKIASIALANNATLLTRNVVDFGKVPGLHTEDWSM